MRALRPTWAKGALAGLLYAALIAVIVAAVPDIGSGAGHVFLYLVSIPAFASAIFASTREIQALRPLRGGFTLAAHRATDRFAINPSPWKECQRGIILGTYIEI